MRLSNFAESRFFGLMPYLPERYKDMARGISANKQLANQHFSTKMRRVAYFDIASVQELVKIEDHVGSNMKIRVRFPYMEDGVLMERMLRHLKQFSVYLEEAHEVCRHEAMKRVVTYLYHPDFDALELEITRKTLNKLYESIEVLDDLIPRKRGIPKSWGSRIFNIDDFYLNRSDMEEIFMVVAQGREHEIIDTEMLFLGDKGLVTEGGICFEIGGQSPERKSASEVGATPGHQKFSAVLKDGRHRAAVIDDRQSGSSDCEALTCNPQGGSGSNELDDADVFGTASKQGFPREGNHSVFSPEESNVRESNVQETDVQENDMQENNVQETAV